MDFLRASTHFKGICFLDRDGTLNENTGYPHRREELILLEGVGRAIQFLNKNQIGTVVVTNQSGVGRGYFSLEAMHNFNHGIDEALQKEDAYIDLWRYCPHHPDDHCLCRKPKTGMIDDILDQLRVPHFFVGDARGDMLCAKNAKSLPIALANTAAAEVPDVYIASNLLSAAKYVVAYINNLS